MNNTATNQTKIVLNLVAIFTCSVCILISTYCLPFTNNEGLTLKTTTLTLSEYISLRRSYFMGHKEFSDVLSGISVIAASVDMFTSENQNPSTIGKMDARFQDAIQTTKFLARFSIGMNEIYLLPAQFLLFERNEPLRAFEIIKLGVKDARTGPGVTLLAGFISQFFVHDLQLASNYYEILSKKPGVPAWVGELAIKLRQGYNPLIENKKLKDALIKAFPRATKYFETKIGE